MKKIIIASFAILTMLSGCSETDLFEKSPIAPGGETPDIPREVINENGQVEIDLTQNFRDTVLDYKWVGGEGDLNLAKYLVFSEDGNVKMYTKPFANQDWELIKDFTISKVKLPKDTIDLMELSLEDVEKYEGGEGEISIIISWKEVLDLNVTPGVEDAICIVLYPAGVPVGGEAFGSMNMCLSGAGQRMTIDMLGTTFNLLKQ